MFHPQTSIQTVPLAVAAATLAPADPPKPDLIDIPALAVTTPTSSTSFLDIEPHCPIHTTIVPYLADSVKGVIYVRRQRGGGREKGRFNRTAPRVLLSFWRTEGTVHRLNALKALQFRNVRFQSHNHRQIFR